MSEYDGIRLCEKCGEYTMSILCTSCQQQQQIDDDTKPIISIPDFDDDDDSLYYEDYDDDDDDDYLNYHDWDYDYGYGYEPEYHYYPITRRERVTYNVTHLSEYLPALIRRLKHTVRYAVDSKYRASIDEIPF